VAWVAAFSEAAAAGKEGLLGHYRLLGLISKKLAEQKEAIEAALTARSPLERYDDLDPKTREKMEDELAAAIEAEYRRQRAELIGALQWWLRDVWLHTLAADGGLLTFPDLASSREVAGRISSTAALSNLEETDRLQRQLHSNVQEALALEVGLLKLKL
jgi:hypothetical protein